MLRPDLEVNVDPRLSAHRNGQKLLQSGIPELGIDGSVKDRVGAGLAQGLLGAEVDGTMENGYRDAPGLVALSQAPDQGDDGVRLRPVQEDEARLHGAGGLECGLWRRRGAADVASPENGPLQLLGQIGTRHDEQAGHGR